MAKKTKMKMQKLEKKQLPQYNKIEKKKKKSLKKKKLHKTVPKKQKQTPNPTQPPYDSDSNSDSEPENIENLLEPYTKDQLIDFVVAAALTDADLLARIHTVADGDISHRKIFVFGLGWDTTRETLVAAFQPYGEIEECNVITDRVTGKAKGYGFVLFKTRQGANKSLKQPGKNIGNRMTSCQLASAGSAAAPAKAHVAGRKIYVSNVPADVDPEKLKLLFATFGEIEAGPIGFDMYTGKSRGFALFVYKTLEGARKALQEPHKLFEGSQLHCQIATDGKNKTVTTVQTVQVPVLAAAQNLAAFGQNPYFNPNLAFLSQNPNLALYSQNPNLALYSQNPNLAMGLGGYGAIGSQGMGNFAGSYPSVLGAYGSSGPMQMGIQYAYPSSQIGQTSSAVAKTPGVGGSFIGRPS